MKRHALPMTDATLARVAGLFRAVGDVGRLKLLSQLLAREATVTELATSTELPMSTVSQQLRLLRAAQLVKRRRSGKQLFYTVAHASVCELVELAADAAIRSEAEGTVASAATKSAGRDESSRAR